MKHHKNGRYHDHSIDGFRIRFSSDLHDNLKMSISFTDLAVGVSSDEWE